MTGNKKSFSRQRLCTYIRFKTEAWDKSKMAYLQTGLSMRGDQNNPHLPHPPARFIHLGCVSNRCPQNLVKFNLLGFARSKRRKPLVPIQHRTTKYLSRTTPIRRFHAILFSQESITTILKRLSATDSL